MLLFHRRFGKRQALTCCEETGLELAEARTVGLVRKIS